MTPEQREELKAATGAVLKARRKLRKVATEILPVGAVVTFARGDSIVAASVVSHGEDFEGLHARGSDLASYKVTYAELSGLKRDART